MSLINKIEKQISVGNYNQALEILNSIKKERELSNEEDLIRKYVSCFIYLDKGKYKEGRILAIKIIKESRRKGYILREIDGIIALIENNLSLGLIKESIKRYNRGMILLERIESIHKDQIKTRKAYLIFLRAKIYRDLHQLSKATELFIKSYELRKEINDKFGMIWSLQHWATSISFLGKFKEAEKYLEESLVLAKELNAEIAIIWNLIFFGWIKFQLSDLEKAISMAKESLLMCESKDYKNPIQLCYEILGHCYLIRGQLNDALSYFKKCLIIRQQEEYHHLIPESYYNIGEVLRQKGELNESLVYYNKTLELVDFEAGEMSKPLYLSTIGKVYGELNDFPTAREYLLKALDLLEKGNIPVFRFLSFKISITSTLHNLILLSVNSNDFKNVNNYLDRLHQLSITYPNIEQFNLLYRLDKAIILKSSNRLMDKMTAGEMFNKIINEDIIDHEITVEAMKNLCEILIYELELSGDKEIIKEIENLSDKMLKIGMNEFLYALLAETYFFKAKIALLKLEVNNARILLTKAQNTAIEHGLKRLANKISNEHDSLLMNLDIWEKKIKESDSLIGFLQEAKYDFLFPKDTNLKKNKNIEKNDIPVYFIIINNINAEYIYSKAFQDINIDDGSLIAGYISAINLFGKEAFSSSGSIDRIKHGDYLTILQLKKEFLFGYVYKGYSYSAIMKLNKFIEKLGESTNNFESITIDFEKNLKLPKEINQFINKIVKEIFL
ncbi:MAG: tetratricopeptide repeat protein [Candidatus Lokiarchaeota archaeon]|nr:tetratricopeptide repeat protein [Candidatus Lokiarchaeota archaeon]